MLIGQFWGTSAAEGCPAPFCRCDTCNYARIHGGKNIRLRSCFRLSDEIMLDLGADAVVQSMRFGELSQVNHVLFSHTHDDHLNPHMLMEAMWSKQYRETLHCYFTDQAYEIVEHWRQSPWILKGMVPEWEKQGYVAFHRLLFGQRARIADIEVIPFRGNHPGNVGEQAALYLIFLPDGRTLFYGLDSGEYLPETIDALKAYHIDFFISEATGGTQDKIIHKVHQSIRQVRDLTEILFKQGTLDPNSRLYLTHISHNYFSTYSNLLAKVEELAFPIPATVAYDGLKIL